MEMLPAMDWFSEDTEFVDEDMVRGSTGKAITLETRHGSNS